MHWQEVDSLHTMVVLGLNYLPEIAERGKQSILKIVRTDSAFFSLKDAMATKGI